MAPIDTLVFVPPADPVPVLLGVGLAVVEGESWFRQLESSEDPTVKRSEQPPCLP